MADILYNKQSVVSVSQLEDIAASVENEEWKTTTIHNSNTVDSNFHRSMSKKIDIRNFPDINVALRDVCSTVVKDINKRDFYVREQLLVRYNPGDFFKLHRQDEGSKDQPPNRIRVFTSLSVVEASEDLSGGSMLIGDNEYLGKLDPVVGETITFRSNRKLAIDVVEKGTIVYLFSWIFKHR